MWPLVFLVCMHACVCAHVRACACMCVLALAPPPPHNPTGVSNLNFHIPAHALPPQLPPPLHPTPLPGENIPMTVPVATNVSMHHHHRRHHHATEEGNGMLGALGRGRGKRREPREVTIKFYLPYAYQVIKNIIFCI